MKRLGNIERDLKHSARNGSHQSTGKEILYDGKTGEIKQQTAVVRKHTPGNKVTDLTSLRQTTRLQRIDHRRQYGAAQALGSGLDERDTRREMSVNARMVMVGASDERTHSNRHGEGLRQEFMVKKHDGDDENCA